MKLRKALRRLGLLPPKVGAKPMAIEPPPANGPLQAEIDQFKWFHSIDFGNGHRSRGVVPLNVLRALADVLFSEPIRGKTLLDIGCFDGFFSIEAARRGAKVLATDYFVWHNGWDRGSFELARHKLAPQIRVHEISLEDISPKMVGMHDVVLFAGVLYHTRHPFLALEQAASVAKDLLIVETHMDAANETRPAMIMYPGKELNDDPTNWWGPNRQCVEAMLRDLGFEPFRFTQHPAGPMRGIFHARRIT
jgi:tRNA (mo5U34)-methyltransferase